MSADMALGMVATAAPVVLVVVPGVPVVFGAVRVPLTLFLEIKSGDGVAM